MKLNAFLIAAAVAISSVSAPALAKGDSSARYDQWEQKLRARVDALHVYPNGAKADAMGDVIVGFRIGADGKPTDIAVHQTSGEAAFDAAAVNLVSRLGRLGPIPADGNVQQVQLKLSYGETSRMLAKADREERVANERRNRVVVSSATEVAEKR